MTLYQSKKWKLFASRPTSILKRDFLKWTYLSSNQIKGFKLTQIITIGNEHEMDVFVDGKEDKNNYLQITKQYNAGKIKKFVKSFNDKIANYKPWGNNPIERSLNAMKEIGPIIIYTYYLERLIQNLGVGMAGRLSVININSRLRDDGAKIVYPLYDKAFNFILNKTKNKKTNHFTLAELERAPKSAEVKKRKKFYIFWGTANQTSIYTGKKTKIFLKREGFLKIQNVSGKELTGLGASHGRVRGRVKIVRGLYDLKRCIGKIVVSRETIIEYTSMLKKNLAIVTDLGGISSHAAVVAREFKIPCIIGTKIATKVLHNGQLIEVDANKGTVRILKKK